MGVEGVHLYLHPVMVAWKSDLPRLLPEKLRNIHHYAHSNTLKKRKCIGIPVNCVC